MLFSVYPTSFISAAPLTILSSNLKRETIAWFGYCESNKNSFLCYSHWKILTAVTYIFLSIYIFQVHCRLAKTFDVQMLTKRAAEFLRSTKFRSYLFSQNYKMCFWKINTVQSLSSYARFCVWRTFEKSFRLYLILYNMSVILSNAKQIIGVYAK